MDFTITESRKYKLFFIGLLIVIAYLLYASTTAIPEAKLLYDVKRGQEKLFLATKSSPESRANYLMTLLDNRSEEIRQLVETERSDFLWSESLRYASHLGELTDLINTYQLTEVKEELKIKLDTHKELLKSLVDKIPTFDGREDYKFLQDTVNYIDLNLEKIK